MLEGGNMEDITIKQHTDPTRITFNCDSLAINSDKMEERLINPEFMKELKRNISNIENKRNFWI